MSKRFGLDDVEGGDVVGLTPPSGLSTPHTTSTPNTAASPVRRPQRPQKTSTTTTPARRPQRSQKATSARPEVPTPKPQTEDRLVAGERAPQRSSRRPGRPTLPPSDSETTRATNVIIPVSLFDQIAAFRDTQHVSTGELIAAAIETHVDELPDLIAASKRPRPAGMFSTRSSRLPRRGDEPERPITYRMTAQDLATIDGLVESLGACSRGHLITVALTTYLATKA